MADTFELRSKWEEAISEAGLDAVIFPPAALPALPHGAARELTPAFSYMFLANLLHWPAGVVPVTLVRKDEEVRHTRSARKCYFLFMFSVCTPSG